jgi:hypothetical protein
MTMPTDFEGLVERTREWSRLRQLSDGLTPQQRGQRFNSFLAEVLQCWGIAARPNQRTIGEIDVAFRIADQRFILEAKWEASPTGTGALAKLKTRVQQRLAGVLGVFVSMSGYSDEALDELNIGQRSEVLLLDKQHVEAMLSGLVSPMELFDAALDHAFYTGRPYAPLEELFVPPPVPELSFETPQELASGVADATGVAVEVVLADIPVGHLGFTELRDGILLLSTRAGVLEVNLEERTATQRVPLTGCVRRPLSIDERLLFVRGAGVGMVENGTVSSVAGPFRGSTTLLTGPGGSPWALSSGDALGGGGSQLAELGELGCERRTDLPYPAANSRNAIWLGANRFAVTGNMGTLTIDLSSDEHTLARGIGTAPNEDGVMRLSETALLLASDGARLWQVGLHDGSFLQRAHVPLPDSGHELEPARTGTAYLSCPMHSSPGSTAILRCTLPDD